jgi:hypothetical protein
MCPTLDTGGVTLTLLTGVNPVALRRRAFQRADTVATDAPESIVVATPDTGTDAAVADEWVVAHDPLRLRVTDLDELADDDMSRQSVRRHGSTRSTTPEHQPGTPRCRGGNRTPGGTHTQKLRELLSELAAATLVALNPERVVLW